MAKHLAALFFGVAFTGFVAFAADKVPANGRDIEITLIAHASVQLEHAGKVVHVDRWRQGDYRLAKPANLVLVNDTQSDHLEIEAIGKIRKPGAPVVTRRCPSSGSGRHCAREWAR